MNIINYDAITLEDCIVNFAVNDMIPIIENGVITSFIKDPSISFNTLKRVSHHCKSSHITS